MMKRLVVAVALSLAFAAGTASAAPPHDVAVTSPRVHVADVVPGATVAAAAVDLGPSPTAGGSRVIRREEILAALAVAQAPAPADVPEAVRVVRRARHLRPAELEAIVRNALVTRPVARGVGLAAVRPPRAIDVADGWSRVDVEAPRPPKKAGSFPTTAIVSFFTNEGEVIGRIAVPIDLAVSPDGATYDSARGAAVTLIVRRGLVEVRTPGVTMADADVGDVVPVQLRPVGRVLRARLVANDQALALEDGQ